MRILRVDFMNINSLAGKWHIDFTRPEYLDSGIFAIVGETGSGKTTIFDAICTALYGTTPRQKEARGSAAELITRGTGEAFSEVLFEIDGKHWKARWEQSRAHKRPDGMPQNAIRILTEIETGTAIEGASKVDGNSKNPGAVTALLKMDFEQFTRACMLAQGAFTAFLDSPADSRANILEQMTGTEIYSTISAKVFNKYKEAEKNYELQTAELSGCQQLSQEDRKKYEDELSASQNNLESIKKDIAVISNKIDWMVKFEEYTQEIADLEKARHAFDQNQAMLQNERNEYELAKRAEPMRTLLNALNDKRSELEKRRLACDSLQHHIHIAKEEMTAALLKFETCEAALCNAKKDEETAAPQIKEMRQMDADIDTVRQRLTDIGLSLKQRKADKQESQKAIASILEQKCILEEKLKKADAWHSENIEYSNLSAQFSLIEDKSKQIDLLTIKIEDVSIQLNDIKKKHEAAKQIYAECQNTISTIQIQQARSAKTLEKSEMRLADILKGSRLEDLKEIQEALSLSRERALIIASLDEQRKRLKHDEECPLCGSKDHPFCTGTELPSLDEEEMKIAALKKQIGEAENALKIQQDTKNSIQDLQLQIASYKGESDKAQLQIDNIEEKCKNITNTHDELYQNRKEIIHTLKEICSPYFSMENFEWNHSLLKELQKRIIAWDKNEENIKDLKTHLNEFDSIIAGLEGSIKALESQIQEAESRNSELTEQIRRMESVRMNKYGTDSPDKLETYYKQKTAQAQKKREDASKIKSNSEKEHTSKQSQYECAIQETQLGEEALKQAQVNFNAGCGECGFADETAVIAAILDPDEYHRNKVKFDKMDKEGSDIKTRIAAANEKMHIHEAKRCLDSDDTLETLKAHLSESDAKRSENEQQIGKCTNALEKDDSIRTVYDIKKSKLMEFESELERWKELNDLLGSSKGDAYKRFVQGLIFSTLLNSANDYLKQFYSRYILISEESRIQQDTQTKKTAAIKDSDAFNIYVYDRYQGDEIRPVSNLSGGEKFIVSLALALGLSKMSSSRVTIDSLFIDEGFGSLDGELAHTAVSVLKNLHIDGKVIGIISHISAVEEEIITQIRLKRNASSSRSTMEQYFGDTCFESSQESQLHSVPEDGALRKKKRRTSKKS